MEPVGYIRLAGRVLHFGDFQLDRVDGRLWRGDQEIALRAKSFELLRYLVENCDRVLTRDELLNAIWGGAAVSPGLVRTSVLEVRKALGEAAASLLETVGRKGYRFTAESTPAIRQKSFVGRGAELAQLHASLERCRGARRQIVVVAGEPGIGKTTLVQRFTDEVRGARLARVAQGQCVDLHGSTEPYLPVLQLLNDLCDSDADRKVSSVLERWAPSWLLQMPGVVDERLAESLRQRVPSPTRERMLREFADALDVLARTTPLMLVLEDLHWSDASTVDLLTYLAERTTPARLLIIGTYRPVDAVIRVHEIRTIVRDLLSRGRASDMTLEALTASDVDAYLSRFFAGSPIDPHLADVLHSRTDGNPLFLTAMIEHLLERNALAVIDGRWQLSRGDEGVPTSLRELVRREVEALSEDDQRILSAASVVGVDFDAISVAAATNQPQATVEDRCARLSARGQLVRAHGTTRWPDGTVSGTYKFLHALHRDVVYDRLAPAERARLHRAVADRLESGWARERESVAAVLAGHFGCACDWLKAAQYHLDAADVSKLRQADHEVLAHCEAVDALLPRLPPSPERDRIEMMCSLESAASLMITQGYGIVEMIRPRLIRARDLARGSGLMQIEVPCLGALYMFETIGANTARALEVANELMVMAERFPMPLFAVAAHTSVAGAHYIMGNLVDARSHFESARAAWNPNLPPVRFDSKILILSGGSLVLQLLGETKEADAWIDELIEHSRGVRDAFNAITGYRAVSMYRYWAGDRDDAAAWAKRSIQSAVESGLPSHEVMAKIDRGHALNEVAPQREGLAFLQALGYRLEIPAYRIGIAEALIGEQRWQEAGDELALAAAAAEETGELRHLAEIHRLRATCLRATRRSDEAVAALQQALDIARRQQAAFFERRVLADLQG